jgi:hypothetical protein
VNAALWIVQVLLGLLFLWAGGFKLVMPLEGMGPLPVPAWFLKFIAVAEVLGGLGLLLPGLAGIRPGLTPLAAAGLVVIMIGATAISFATGPVLIALMPLITGVLAAFVAYGRWRVVPHQARAAR